MSMVSINKRIPVPQRGAAQKKYPWADMDIGDSFFVPGVWDVSVYKPSRQHNMKFVKRIVVEDGVSGIRIWRTQ